MILERRPDEVVTYELGREHDPQHDQSVFRPQELRTPFRADIGNYIEGEVTEDQG